MAKRGRNKKRAKTASFLSTDRKVFFVSAISIALLLKRRNMSLEGKSDKLNMGYKFDGSDSHSGFAKGKPGVECD